MPVSHYLHHFFIPCEFRCFISLHLKGFQWNIIDGYCSSDILLRCSYQFILLCTIVSKMFSNLALMPLRMYLFVIFSVFVTIFHFLLRFLFHIIECNCLIVTLIFIILLCQKYWLLSIYMWCSTLLYFCPFLSKFICKAYFI